MAKPAAPFDEVCREFAAAVSEANLHFGARHDDLVRSFVVALATKPLVVLTGLSGSGKTRLATAFGEWLGPAHSLVVPVRPDWTGPEFVLGYEDALLRPDEGRRAWAVPRPLAFMLRAVHDQGSPYLLILDEMNLAHVERYFADLLSGMESGKEVLPNLVHEDGFWRLAPGEPEYIPVPRNLFVVGTVNVDETTYMFSPKVLDRANTLEFRVHRADLRVDGQPPTPVPAAEEHLVNGFLAVATDRTFHTARPASNRDDLAGRLLQLHDILGEHDLEFGHRVFSEALRFAAVLEAAGEANPWRALDMQVKQKILPRLHGSARRLTAPLAAVAAFCFDFRTTSGADFAVEDMKEGDAALTESYEKLRRMARSLRLNQFAGFAE